jgi:hypothetical protein
MQSEPDWANATRKDVREMKAGDRVIADRHWAEDRYQSGVITGVSPPGWVYYRPDDRNTIVATDPSNIRVRESNHAE